ncbi:MAG: hypothetical protein EA391_01715 [Balneolaceae bacterium]|nr:MAG: hypothetical protein EA391_01715 [Balneolaceae bacterium]
MAAISIRSSQSAFRILLTAAFVVTIGLMWTGYAQPDERILTLRYLLFALSGIVAFSTPYLLFPDEKAPLIQLGNLGNGAVIRYIFVRLAPVVWPVFLLIFVILFGDLSTPGNDLGLKLTHFISGSVLFGATVLFAISRNIKSGTASQFWKESDKGKKIRQHAADYFKYPLDPGSIPSLINTILIALFGAIPILIGTVLAGIYSAVTEAFLMFLMLSLARWSFQSQMKNLVCNYYSTNAFFREFFGSNMKGEELSEKRTVEQLWWVPAPIRMHVWQFLVQLDRVIPSGRVVFSGHVVMLFLAYQQPDAGFLLVAWILFALLHHLFMLMTYRKEISPGWLHGWMASSATWFTARFWMQLRWVLPLLIGMNVQFFIFGTPNYSLQSIVLTVYLIASALMAGIGISGSSTEVKV